MKPQISEFSYGFALTNELVGWEELSAAPVFPSLLEEGRPGGGYDVKLDRPGVPLYLQFKRSEFMTRRSGREAKALAQLGHRIGIPYYRFAITEGTISQQHNMLLALDVSPNFVFYAAPRFHRLSEIDDAWHASAVASRSQFVAPNLIGRLPTGSHTVAFDRTGFWVCSEPRRIEGLNSRQLADKLKDAIKADNRPFRLKLPELASDLVAAEERGRALVAEQERQDDLEREAYRHLRRPDRWADRDIDIADIQHVEQKAPWIGLPSAEEGDPDLEAPEPDPVSIRAPAFLGPERRMLREAADRAARTFESQLVVIQPAD